MTEYKLIDSSVWVEYLVNSNYKEIIESEEIYLLSSLSILEIKKKLLKLNYKKEDILNSLNFIKERSNIMTVNQEIAEMAADICIGKSLGAVDAVIYATSIANNSLLITLDNDFRGLENVQILD
ncbi:MAG: PIN domain-containing protein [Nanoarchaeota archaeon]